MSFKSNTWQLKYGHESRQIVDKELTNRRVLRCSLNYNLFISDVSLWRRTTVHAFVPNSSTECSLSDPVDLQCDGGQCRGVQWNATTLINLATA